MVCTLCILFNKLDCQLAKFAGHSIGSQLVIMHLWVLNEKGMITLTNIDTSCHCQMFPCCTLLGDYCSLSGSESTMHFYCAFAVSWKVHFRNPSVAAEQACPQPLVPNPCGKIPMCPKFNFEMTDVFLVTVCIQCTIELKKVIYTLKEIRFMRWIFTVTLSDHSMTVEWTAITLVLACPKFHLLILHVFTMCHLLGNFDVICISWVCVCILFQHNVSNEETLLEWELQGQQLAQRRFNEQRHWFFKWELQGYQLAQKNGLMNSVIDPVLEASKNNNEVK